jgi:hypothetical protein
MVPDTDVHLCCFACGRVYLEALHCHQAACSIGPTRTRCLISTSCLFMWHLSPYSYCCIIDFQLFSVLLCCKTSWQRDTVHFCATYCCNESCVLSHFVVSCIVRQDGQVVILLWSAQVRARSSGLGNSIQGCASQDAKQNGLLSARYDFQRGRTLQRRMCGPLFMQALTCDGES